MKSRSTRQFKRKSCPELEAFKIAVESLEDSVLEHPPSIREIYDELEKIKKNVEALIEHLRQEAIQRLENFNLNET